ncbi:MAG: thioredoxin family protein [Pseudomonadota bacterium]|nr:thioredoxin family protein [Pseudomonadota bacterium]MDP1572673.1 thioredoxin family protein [Pseudomonadota bacterium]MDP1906546.1 thioredoxin family protein [Pseudomonadota bacterium]
MRWLALALTLVFALPALAEVRDPHSHFFMSKMGDFKDELATAKQEGKQGVLIMFEMEECPFCSRMKGTVLNQSEVQDWYRKHFLIYTIDVKGGTDMTDFQGIATTEKAFALANRARATPTFLFFDLEGNAITRFTGATQTTEEFLLLGRYVAEGAYKTLAFNVYKKQAAKP